MNMTKRLKILPLCGCVAVLMACTSAPSRESTGEYIDDAVITSKVLAKLAASEDTSAASINVETFKGVVQLSGFVPTQEEAVRAEELAASVDGVRKVENKLTVTLGVGSLYLNDRPPCPTYFDDQISCRLLGY